MIYYKLDTCIVRTSEKEDIDILSKTIREDDRAEIWKSHHRTPKEALQIGFNDSIICLTVEKDGIPIVMFGINAENILGKTATIWMLSSDKLLTIKKQFIKQSRKFINMMLDYYPILSNCVDADNTVTKRWLKYCGAEFGLAVPYGIEQQPFFPFQFIRR